MTAETVASAASAAAMRRSRSSAGIREEIETSGAALARTEGGRPAPGRFPPRGSGGWWRGREGLPALRPGRRRRGMAGILGVGAWWFGRGDWWRLAWL